LWFVPLVITAGAVVLAVVMITIDHLVKRQRAPLAFDGDAGSATEVLSTISASTLTFTALVFSITIVALQLASSQFSPRVLRLFLRDRGSQVALGVFVATFVFAFIALQSVREGGNGLEPFVPGYTITVSLVLVFVTLATFVYYVDHVAHSVRAVNIIEAVARETRATIEANYPRTPSPTVADAPPAGSPSATIVNRVPGVVLGYDEDDLVALARRHGCILRLVYRVGDYVPTGAPLLEVHGGDGGPPPDDVLRHVGIGITRTMEQDVAFGFRQLVDIAEKALSPAINDPTTAVQALDRLHDFLRRMADRPWPTGLVPDDDGRLRLIHPVAGWDDLVLLAFTEIRLYGAGSIQTARRLRAVLDDLLALVPDDRRGVIAEQIELLDADADRLYAQPHDRRLATRADEQGLGS
jgi:uncharacterized membrane protein